MIAQIDKITPPVVIKYSHGGEGIGVSGCHVVYSPLPRGRGLGFTPPRQQQQQHSAGYSLATLLAFYQ